MPVTARRDARPCPFPGKACLTVRYACALLTSLSLCIYSSALAKHLHLLRIVIECLACTLKLEEPARRATLTRRFHDLPDADPALIEHTISQLKTWTRSICSLPSSLAASLASPSHTNKIESPATKDDLLIPLPTTSKGGDATHGQSTSSAILSPVQACKQNELDYLMDVGAGRLLVRLLQKHVTSPQALSYVTEYALGILRDIMLTNAKDDLARHWVREEHLLDVLLDLLSFSSPASSSHAYSTILSGVLDVLIALYGTTGIANDPQYIEPVSHLLQYTVDILQMTDKQVREGLEKLEGAYQLDLLAILPQHVAAYAPRWNQILKDKAMLCICTLFKCRSVTTSTSLPLYQQTFRNMISTSIVENNDDQQQQGPVRLSMLVKFACVHTLDLNYPETDIYVNASLCLLLLMPNCLNLFTTTDNDILYSTAQTLRNLLKQKQQMVDDIMVTFYGGDNGGTSTSPVSPMYSPQDPTTNRRLHAAAQQAVTQRARQIAILVAILSRAAIASPASAAHFLDVFRDLRDMIHSKTPTGAVTDEKESILRDYLLTETFAKTVRVGLVIITAAVIPTVTDSLLECLLHLQKVNGPSLTVPAALVRSRLLHLKPLARQQFAARQFAQAERAYQLCICFVAHASSDTETCALRGCRAECLLQLGRIQEAIKECTVALTECSPSHTHYIKLTNRLDRAQIQLNRKSL